MLVLLLLIPAIKGPPVTCTGWLVLARVF